MHRKTRTANTQRPSDECGPYQWRCDNGFCINNEFVCDSTNDCTDNSDEIRGCTRAGKVYFNPMYIKKVEKATEISLQ